MNKTRQDEAGLGGEITVGVGCTRLESWNEDARSRSTPITVHTVQHSTVELQYDMRCDTGNIGTGEILNLLIEARSGILPHTAVLAIPVVWGELW